MDNLHNELKKEFQLERMILFSDAVFAIAITLLVIEIKVPELHENVTEKALLKEIGHLVPKFLGFIISFMIIGAYWTIHHRLFGYITKLTSKLTALNFFFLFTIVLMPFSTGIFGEYSRPSTLHLITPYAVYILNICLTGLANYLLWSYVSKPANQVAEGLPDQQIMKHAKQRALLIPVIFFCSLLVALWNPYVGRYVPLLIPIVLKLVIKKPKNKTLKSYV
jgi:uncharacterized membrane protein